jgi:hypothetical protein
MSVSFFCEAWLLGSLMVAWFSDLFPIVVLLHLCFPFQQQPAFVKMAIQKKRPGCVSGVSIGFILLFSS